MDMLSALALTVGTGHCAVFIVQMNRILWHVGPPSPQTNLPRAPETNLHSHSVASKQGCYLLINWFNTNVLNYTQCLKY